VQNAFSVALSPFGFDFHRMLTVDILHEVELGVWKALLMHLIRMLHTYGANKVQEFDARYGSLDAHELECLYLPRPSFRMVPAFGDKIRRFEGNISEMKRLAGRDLEDVLQARSHIDIKDTVLIITP